MYELWGYVNEIMVGDAIVFTRPGETRVKNDGGAIVFSHPGWLMDYWISLDRVDNAAKIFSWIVHLSRKDWMTPDLLCEFTAVALAAARLPIDFDA